MQIKVGKHSPGRCHRHSGHHDIINAVMRECASSISISISSVCVSVSLNAYTEAYELSWNLEPLGLELVFILFVHRVLILFFSSLLFSFVGAAACHFSCILFSCFVLDSVSFAIKNEKKTHTQNSNSERQTNQISDFLRAAKKRDCHADKICVVVVFVSGACFLCLILVRLEFLGLCHASDVRCRVRECFGGWHAF